MFSIRSRILLLMLLCWLVPMALITGANVYYLSGSSFEEKIGSQIQQLKYDNKITIQQLEQAIRASKEASYDGELISLYKRYRRGDIMDHELVSKSTYYLTEHYSRDERIRMALLWYREDIDNLYCGVYNPRTDATYNDVKRYWEKDHEKVKKVSDDLDTRIKLVNAGGRLYLVRNLFTPDYENAGTLIFLLNQEQCFKDYESLSSDLSVTMYLDDCKIQLAGQEVTIEETGMDRLGGTSGYTWRNSILKIYNKMTEGNHRLVTLMRYDDSSAFTLFYGYRAIYVTMILCVIPLILVVLWAFYRHVTKPVEELMQGAREIENGNLGYTLDHEAKSKEFLYLSDSFNKMSERLKYQFDHIYEEELALRDARIMALQSHINPHFMNNTLEIINWEARLSGCDKVSHMIEALSTLMDAGIDRRKRPEVPLREEMEYVNAYLYIISERLGKRLTIKKEFPEEIMDYKVPRLILQPVIENSIEHGVVVRGQGTVTLTGYVKEDFLYLEIINEAAMTEKEMEKVARLLDINYDTSKESSGSMGIANVNQRLKILYGDTCGLAVEKMDEDHVMARLTIRAEKADLMGEKD